MECEATYNDEQTCPPLIGLAKLEGRSDLSPRDQRKASKLAVDVLDV
jgi:hypothetical protein